MFNGSANNDEGRDGDFAVVNNGRESALYVKNRGKWFRAAGLEQPKVGNQEYNLATRDYVNSFARPFCQYWGGRGRNQFNNWYWGQHLIYGPFFYYQFYSTSSTSLPTSYADSSAPGYLIPRKCSIFSYDIVGNISTTDTIEWAIMKAAAPTFGSAGNYTLTQVGTTQSAGGTSNILYHWSESNLNVQFNKNDFLMPMFRRTTDNDSSYVYIEWSMHARFR